MNRNEAILHTKLVPPRLPRHTLVRPRLDALLREALDYRVTLVQASTGYGKSTALASLGQAQVPLFWYSVSEGDTDPQQFLAHLIAAFQMGLPALADSPLALLPETYAENIRAATDVLLNALHDHLRVPALLVVDDYHLAESSPVAALLDHWLMYQPANLHTIVSSRYAPTWEHLVTWRARGQVLEIQRDALAFTREEIAALFRDKYNRPLAPHEIETLHDKTEGWPIALQLVWQEIRKSKTSVADLLARGLDNSEERPYLDTLFAYLAHDVLAQQSREVQLFLLQTAVLRELEPNVCQTVAPHHDARAMLNHLRERDLFLIALSDDHYRYHHLFHDFLREQATQLDVALVRERHQRAAEFYQHHQNYDEAMYHFLCAQSFIDAAALIEEIGENILRVGRLDTLAMWLDALPSDCVAARPMLMFYLGDLARLRSRYDEALAWYAQAERAWRVTNDVSGISRALRGQALVYLDTVRPPQAEKILREALRVTDGLEDRNARARVLELLAENKLNVGKADEAEQLRAQARALREEGPSEDVLSVRVKLRTGRLDEAREILETWAREEHGKPHAPRSHRETLLVLSLIYAMQGDAAQAYRAAQAGIALGAQFASPFVTAVGQMRLGHAQQIFGYLNAAIHAYENAIALGDQLAVRRLRAEAMWGLTRANGYRGNLNVAQRNAAEGIQVAKSAGDIWLSGLIQIALGASQTLAHRPRDAIETLDDALAAMRSCGDVFGQCAARVWLALAHWQCAPRQRERALAHLEKAFALAQPRRYDYLFTTRTLLGLHDARMIVPLLIEMRQHSKLAAYATQLLTAMGLAHLTNHPGYQLRVQTFGAFRVWRGENEILAREWQRKKAKQLMQLFITRRGRLSEREEIFELLYRDVPAETAARDFKVALNALNHALQPERGESEPAFIARVESAYGLRAEADVWIDADEFTQLLARVDQAEDDAALDTYRRALALYHDDFLIADARYEDWAIAERERLLALYLRAADRLAAQLFARGTFDECIAWCEKILARDRCWEHAYRLMMQAYAARGDRAQVRRVFEQCKRVLRDELEVDPSAATVEVYRRVVSG